MITERAPPPREALKNNLGLSGSNAWSSNLWAAFALVASFWVQAALTHTLTPFVKFVRLFIQQTPRQGLPRASLGWPGQSSLHATAQRVPVYAHVSGHTHWSPQPPRAGYWHSDHAHRPHAPVALATRLRSTPLAWRGTPGSNAPAGRHLLPTGPSYPAIGGQ